MASRILVVDDEPGIRRVVRGYLDAAGYRVSEAATGEDAVTRTRDEQPELVLLDIMLPDVDGVEVLRRLRTFSDVFVILLTARTEETDKLIGLAVGADDYITKPFSPRELVARVRAVLRRGRAPQREEVIDLAGLVVDLAAHEVRVDAHEVPLSALEFDLLAALAGSSGRVFSRRQLLERVWGHDFFGDERVVDVHVRNLRRKLGDDAADPRFIGTVRGVGYKFLGERA